MNMPYLHNFWRQVVLAPEIRNSYLLTEALQWIQKRWPEKNFSCVHEPSPVFVLAAGWGSGSTLVQRLVISLDKSIVWGEPLDQGGPIHRLSEMLNPIRENWPPDKHFIQTPAVQQSSVETLSNQWIANLMPSLEQLRLAHRAFLETWLGVQNNGQETQCWGLKEVRLTIDHARYLNWLFPKARFIFLYRDLYSSYLSCKGVKWISIWPNHMVSPPSAFAHHWRYLLEGFISGYSDVGGLLVKYEDVISGKTNPQLIADYLGLSSSDTDVLETKLGTRSSGKKLSSYERFILNSIGGELRSRLGYV
jgi:hypothetical protein